MYMTILLDLSRSFASINNLSTLIEMRDLNCAIRSLRLTTRPLGIYVLVPAIHRVIAMLDSSLVRIAVSLG